MTETITRKCAKCKAEVHIERNNITGVISFQGKYYHDNCFEEMATKKAASNRGNPAQWQEALDNLWVLESDTKKMLEHFWAKDDLNAWLLDNYDIVAVPSYFWQLVADLESGKYKNKRCKPIGITTLYSMWRWGQKHLDKINTKNKINHTGPKSDIDRLRYDLAILMSHIEDYKKHVAQIQSLEAERQQRKKDNVQVDYNKIKPIKNNDTGLDDISDLLDELV